MPKQTKLDLLLSVLVGEPPETNERGNAVHRHFYPSDRYIADCDEHHGDWAQFDTDQDASYFGVWVDPAHLRTLTYAEGDWTLVTCPDKDHYNAEIQNMLEFYGEGFIAIGIDSKTGDATRFVQDRSKFLIPESS
jgi:hypothetical protein